MKKRGPKPKDGAPRNTIITGAVTEADLRALKAVMRAKGIRTTSSAVAAAVRAFVKANGVDPQAKDPRQRAIGFLPSDG